MASTTIHTKEDLAEYTCVDNILSAMPSTDEDPAEYTLTVLNKPEPKYKSDSKFEKKLVETKKKRKKNDVEVMNLKRIKSTNNLIGSKKGSIGKSTDIVVGKNNQKTLNLFGSPSTTEDLVGIRNHAIKRFTTLCLDKLPQCWFDLIFGTTSADDIFELLNVIDTRLRQETRLLCPEPENIWRWTRLDPNNVKVVILGQDPYHSVREIRSSCGSRVKQFVRAADGLAFSVNRAYAAVCSSYLPASLSNILKVARPAAKETAKGDLSSWSDQGVLLLNTALTTVCGSPNAHKSIGWQAVTDKIIQALGSRRRLPNNFSDSRQKAKIFMLWGNEAKKKKELIDTKAHAVLESCHPSPLSAHTNGWFKQNHFQDANIYLTAMGSEPILW